METPGAAAVGWGLCAAVAQLIAGSTGSVCSTAVESLDLGCLLRDPWQDVPWCVWVSSHSCDVSHAFSHFELYNMVRLGVHLSPASIVWMKPLKFDYSDFTFSPPSVSASLKDEQLLVKVQFPCAANRRCSLGRCCPLSELIDPWTTVTVYNKLNRSEYQSRTVWTQEVVSRVEFSGLAPGQNYCAVANFSFPTFSMAASPRSAPQCVETVSKSGLLPALLLGLGLTSLLLFPPLAVFLSRPSGTAPAEENRPKIQALVPDPVPALALSSVTIDPRDVHLEFSDDQISIESPGNQKQTSTHTGDPLHRDPSAAYWDPGGTEAPTTTLVSASHVSSDETFGTNGD
ncbi:hypothetical protein EYF80_017818 [Liparis tanakae]|uniref:Interferon/interleukin receptor domain-containing protein n=1 Tax=Liparis tanakae TaxID=230148 RepID=A0A4Z2I2H1_9TELE|nr:hypothetical protein EYF80_017818 [Liparis tanakae]